MGGCGSGVCRMGISGVIVGKMGGGAPTRGMGRGRGATKFGCSKFSTDTHSVNPQPFA